MAGTAGTKEAATVRAKTVAGPTRGRWHPPTIYRTTRPGSMAWLCIILSVITDVRSTYGIIRDESRQRAREQPRPGNRPAAERRADREQQRTAVTQQTWQKVKPLTC